MPRSSQTAEEVEIPFQVKILGKGRHGQETQLAWNEHVRQWGACKRCPLHRHRETVVLTRGTLPCEVLFVGEAPGEVEDALAFPFIGPAGKVLQALIDQAASKLFDKVARDFAYSITNVVGCKPFPAGKSICPPPEKAIAACQPRLVTFINDIAKPKVIVLLGKVAQSHFEESGITDNIGVDKFTSLYHPSYIQRNGGVKSQVFKDTLKKLVRELERIL